MAQRVVIVQILIAERQTIKSLPDHAQQIVFTARLAARIVQDAGHRRAQSQALVGLLQQQYAAVAGDRTTVEIGLNFAPSSHWKLERRLRTVCHGEALLDSVLANCIIKDK